MERQARGIKAALSRRTAVFVMLVTMLSVLAASSTASAAGVTVSTIATTSGCAGQGGTSGGAVSFSASDSMCDGITASANATAAGSNGHLTAGATAVSDYRVLNISGQAYAAAGAMVSLTDTITITSSGTFNLVEMVNGVSTLDPCGTSIGNINNAVWASVSLTTPVGGFGFSDTGYACGTGGISDSIGLNGINLVLVAGQTLSLSATANATATAQANLVNPNVAGISDLSHSLFFYLTPVTPGASYITATGNDYAQSVPAFTFRGFFRPVDNDPVVNKVKAGAGVPVKFSLGGFQGLNIFLVGFPASQPIGCDSFAMLDQVEETVSAGQSGLTYDASLDQYTYVWQTQKAWARTCRQLVLRLSDGTFHIANFQFEK